MTTDFWVFDTNTLMSAQLVQGPTPAKALIKARLNGTLLISAETSRKYFDVFSRPKFDKYISLETRLAFIDNIHQRPAGGDKRKDYCLPRPQKTINFWNWPLLRLHMQ